ncbi:MAG: oxidoreductase [Rhodopirellula sp.]|nr:oxidoreductase [Rhodopirellula sp.]
MTGKSEVQAEREKGDAAPDGEKHKRKLAMYWAASCGGCEIALLGINEKILTVSDAFDIAFWPCIADGKVHDVEAMPDGSIDLCLFNGAIRNSENEYMARLLRAKSKILVAFGSCAIDGGIPGLANLSSRKELLDTVYQDLPATENPDHLRPQVETTVEEGTLHLPLFYKTLKTLSQCVAVDYYLPGCPPEPEQIWKALTAVLEGRLPEKGAVLGPVSTVCDECPRTRSEKKINRFYRTWQIIPDPDICLLDQGIVCCGIATGAGCGACCPQMNMPCIGCYGPPEGVDDQGAQLMSALGSIIDSRDPDEIDRIIQEGIPDPAGSFYRFSLASSLLRRSQLASKENGKRSPTATGFAESAGIREKAHVGS